MSPGFDGTSLRETLRTCSAAGLQVFGADSHCFELNPPLASKAVDEFELRHGIGLPVDYRRFLLEVGDGGAGPSYGVFPLGFMDDNWGMKTWSEGDGFVGVLREPFPHDAPWNDLSGLPADELAKTNPDEYERHLEKFDQRYWNPALMNGAFPLCHMGCALRVWLVVSGGEAGFLWRDGRAELSGLSPIVLKDGTRATFLSWYLEWLDGCFVSVGNRRPRRVET